MFLQGLAIAAAQEEGSPSKAARRQAKSALDYDPEQPRDPRGRWSGEGGDVGQALMQMGREIGQPIDAAHVEMVRAFTNSEHVVEHVAHELTHHGIHIGHHMAAHVVADHLLQAVEYGAGALIGSALGHTLLAATVGSYVVRLAAKKVGLSPQSLHHLLVGVTHSLIDHYHVLRGDEAGHIHVPPATAYHEPSSLEEFRAENRRLRLENEQLRTREEFDAADDDDLVLFGLRNLAEALDRLKAGELKDFNPLHQPAGAEGGAGGQFARKEGALGGGDVPAGSKHPGHGYSTQARLINGIIHTSNVDDAVRALYEGKHVVLSQRREVSTLIDRLGKVAKRMIDMGGKTPSFDLCNVTVPGTNLFCAASKGVWRADMPQIPRGQNEAFRNWLIGRGHGVQDVERYPAANLKATQNELNGAQVAGIAERMREGRYGAVQPIYVSKDDYILDGHHRWAADVGLAAGDPDINDRAIAIRRVDVDINDLLHLADEFTGGRGKKSMSTAAGAGRSELQRAFNARKPVEQLLRHPLFRAAVDAMRGQTPTNKLWGPDPNQPSEGWMRERAFTINGSTVHGYDKGVSGLQEKAESYAVALKRDRQAYIVVGMPAAGKSTTSEPLAKATGSALVDPDDAKAALPEFKAGPGSAAVHEESSLLSGMVAKHEMEIGANIVFPKIGNSANSLTKLVGMLKSNGYTTHLINVMVEPDEAIRRMLGRWLRTSRAVDPDYLRSVDHLPDMNYDQLKHDPRVSSYAAVDANGEAADRRITEGTGEAAQALRRGGSGGP